jgi:hypothetical protein
MKDDTSIKIGDTVRLAHPGLRAPFTGVVTGFHGICRLAVCVNDAADDTQYAEVCRWDPAHLTVVRGGECDD